MIEENDKVYEFNNQTNTIQGVPINSRKHDSNKFNTIKIESSPDILCKEENSLHDTIIKNLILNKI